MYYLFLYLASILFVPSFIPSFIPSFTPSSIKQVSAFKCINDAGKAVDSWLIIKKPKGIEYFYYDSYEKSFKTSPNSLNDTFSGALTYTMKQLWSSNTNYVMYNDQIPKLDTYYNDLYNDVYNDLLEDDSTATNYGHTKGLFAFDTINENGFWITHSIPLFPLGPKQSNKYIGLGSNAFTYAQDALCLSVSADTINDMASMFLLNRPQIYEYKITIDIDKDIEDKYKNKYKNKYKYENKYENIKRLVDGEYSKMKVCESTYLETQDGTRFILYSKTGEWNNDLYSYCITPSLQDTLLVETWIRGSAIGPSCPVSKYDTLDVKYLDFVVDGISNGWAETQDHSKWTITENKNIICMGDINRMTTQYSRGGGSACFEDDILHSIFKQATTQTNKCNNNNNNSK